ncbi:assimilatory sulfite reductase (NADPH) flavoprotein subunit [Marinicella meishanensis]|uniref:assimilatory sulfite reductase (NADPH) flavoprotein subunit n=1 Tax=Marinicella meishanensis TaxID=2873263 RepID=UPI001CBEB265
MKLDTLARLQWPDSPNTEQHWQQLNQLLSQLSAAEKLWLAGFLAGQAQSPEQATTTNQVADQASEQAVLTILYGTQTGNSEGVARDLQSQAANAGLATEVLSLADFSVKQLPKKSHVALIISTHGEGEAPDDAEIFHEQLFAKKAPSLAHLHYSVLALGDSSYELFCHTGKEFDERLHELGAKRLLPRVDCDVDYESLAQQWQQDLLPVLEEALMSAAPAQNNITPLPLAPAKAPMTRVDKHHPVAAEVLAIQAITGRGSGKNTQHIELGIDPTLIQYQPGDSLGIWAHNDAAVVDALLHHWQLQGDEPHTFKEQHKTIRALLTEHIEITQISKPLVQFMAQHINDPALQTLAQSHQQFLEYCEGRQLLDLLHQFDAENQLGVERLLPELKAITPRLYSIASAQSVLDDEVHLTVNLDSATAHGHHGLASGLLCQRLAVDDRVSVYVEPNKHFKLPDDPKAPVIMIGPGTGVAPFRAFMQQRQAQSAPGDNWLFFGNPHFATDFLYQTEWLKWLNDGTLTRLNVAFSRDQADKVYVQDKLRAHAEAVWQWLQQGAHLYVCGDANRMAKDVEQTLLDIISQHGDMSQAEASAHLQGLKRQQRYQKDVY